MKDKLISYEKVKDCFDGLIICTPELADSVLDYLHSVKDRIDELPDEASASPFRYTVRLHDKDAGTAGFNDIGDLFRYVRGIIEDEDDIGKVTIEVADETD